MEQIYQQLAELARQHGAQRLVLFPTLLKLDIVHIMPGMNPKFLENIEKDGVTLYAAEN